MRARLATLLARTLRLNVVLMVLAIWGLPLSVVAGWSLLERDIGGSLQTSASSTAVEVDAALERAAREGASASELEDAVDAIAFRHTARVRLVADEDARTLLEVDRDDGDDVVHRIGTWFFGADGAPTLRALDATLGPVLLRPEVTRARRSAEAPPSTGCRSAPSDKLLVCHAALASTWEGRPVVVYVQESSRRAARAIYDLRYHLARLSVAILPLALVFSWWMGRRMVRPLETLRARVLAKAREANVHADLLPVDAGEVDDLAGAFNDLLATAAARKEEQRAFVADLAHEIKNPAAAIRACAERLSEGDADPARVARIARILEASSTRLDHLVSQFLDLARAEAGLAGEERAVVDLAELAHGVCAATEATSGDVRVVVDAAGPAPVLGAPGRLESVVRNLVDNAVSFAPPGSAVHVRVARRGDDVCLAVADAGPGIAPADLPRVFDRFFTTRARVASAPDAVSPHGGSGLGLALVKAVALAHGGTATARSEGVPGEGAVFEVVLPACPHAFHGAPTEDSSLVPEAAAHAS